MATPFRVGVSRDLIRPNGELGFGGVGMRLLQQTPGLEVEFLPEHGKELTPRDIAGFDALALLGGLVTPATLAGNERLSLVARFGVGYDNVDVPACTANGVFLTITPEAVRRPMAVVNLTFLLALASRLLEQDRLTREGRWADKQDARGTGLVGKTFGTIGFGRIASETHAISKPLGMRHVAHDPYADPTRAAEAGVELVDLDTLLQESDFVVVAAALTPETRHLIDAKRLAMMKPTAFLISTARGPLVDQKALYEALRDKRLAGAALDVFEEEPVDPNDPILQLDNVIVTPHALCWTDECERIMGESVLQSVQEVAAGKVPANVVNREAADSPAMQAKLQRYAAERGA
ncbi:MAG: glyoxylate reductase [Thermomicrobiales bacterium]|nr:glyoxylate reductase [Thermomicrobiales bacterium]